MRSAFANMVAKWKELHPRLNILFVPWDVDVVGEHHQVIMDYDDHSGGDWKTPTFFKDKTNRPWGTAEFGDVNHENRKNGQVSYVYINNILYWLDKYKNEDEGKPNYPLCSPFTQDKVLAATSWTLTHEPFHSIGGVSRRVDRQLVLNSDAAHYNFPTNHPKFFIMNRYDNTPMPRKVGSVSEMEWHDYDKLYAPFVLGIIPLGVTIPDFTTTPNEE